MNGLELIVAEVAGGVLEDAAGVEMQRAGVSLARGDVKAQLLNGLSSAGRHIGFAFQAPGHEERIVWSIAFPTADAYRDAVEEVFWRWHAVICQENGWPLPERPKRLPPRTA